MNQKTFTTDGVKKLIHQDSDRFSQLLNQIRLKDSFFVKTFCHGNWGFDNPQLEGALYHFLVHGEAQVESDNGEFIHLSKGDFVLFSRGSQHVLRKSESSIIQSFDDIDIDDKNTNFAQMHLGNGELDAVFICGGLCFDPLWHPLLEALPNMLVYSSKNADSILRSKTFIEEIEHEVTESLPGSEAVIARLCEALIIQMIRFWMMEEMEPSTGWIYALRDKHLGNTLAKIHQKPEYPWTLEILAKEADLSRTAYTQRFHKYVGTPPMQYVTRLRMNLAADKIKASTDSNEKIANEVGYDSVVSFSRAFKRYWGRPPGSFRI